MKAALRWEIAIAVSAILFSCAGGPTAEGIVRIQPDVAVKGVEHFGVNLGYRTSWGAEQLISNVVMNPGFEGIVDRALVAVQPIDQHHFLDQSRWLGRADGFWTGAGYEVRTGSSAGHRGKIASSQKSGAQGLPEFVSNESLPPMHEGDRIALTKITDDQLPTQWWIPQNSSAQVSTVAEMRPGSAGVRSLRLCPKPNSNAEVHSYLDAIGERAGALLPITGNWRLSFWTRGPQTTNLTVTFRRDRGRAWLNRTLTVSSKWQLIELTFAGGEDDSHGMLDLAFRASGELLLDDVDLRKQSDRSAFREEVIETLGTLHPSYLRDWQGQLGDTLSNRLASSDSRRASRYRPGGSEGTYYGYSLPEFLDLCRQVHASPWIVAPTTFSDDEWAGLGRYLASRSAEDRFSEILVEFGNENWNGIFAAAGIGDAAQHADAATRGFRILTEAAKPLTIKPVINAQYANPSAVADLAQRMSFGVVIAVAPYFFRELKASQTKLDSLFVDDANLQKIHDRLQNSRQEMAVYEVNVHTTEGDASGEARSPMVAGAAAGSALAAHLLDGLSIGIRRQCVYVLSGFDYRLRDSLGYARIWGIARDLGPTRRLRPTGLALAMLNQAVAGELHKCSSPKPDLHVAPFRSKAGWSVAIASTAAEAREVKLEFPEAAGAPLPARCLTLHSPDPLATNEESEQVTIAPQRIIAEGRMIHLHLPAYGLAVLLPEESHGR